MGMWMQSFFCEASSGSGTTPLRTLWSSRRAHQVWKLQRRWLRMQQDSLHQQQASQWQQRGSWGQQPQIPGCNASCAPSGGACHPGMR